MELKQEISSSNEPKNNKISYLKLNTNEQIVHDNDNNLDSPKKLTFFCEFNKKKVFFF